MNKFYYSDGSTSSNLDGSKLLHRVDGPAMEWNNGSKEWWLNGKRHRVDGSAIEWDNGDKEWYLNGKRHRVDGPAIEWADGDKSWYLNGKLHRIDGPAIEWKSNVRHWYLNGECYIKEQFNKVLKEANEMCTVLQLTDPREWVRELGRKRIKE